MVDGLEAFMQAEYKKRDDKYIELRKEMAEVSAEMRGISIILNEYQKRKPQETK
jgi:uncharacterized protein YeeX (DUF496 family)